MLPPQGPCTPGAVVTSDTEDDAALPLHHLIALRPFPIVANLQGARLLGIADLGVEVVSRLAFDKGSDEVGRAKVVIAIDAIFYVVYAITQKVAANISLQDGDL